MVAKPDAGTERYWEQETHSPRCGKSNRIKASA